MNQKMFRLWLPIALALLFSLASAEDVEFNLVAPSAANNYLTLHIESNLPDNAEVRVVIERAYEATKTKAGVSDTYSLVHFREKETLGQWREPRQVSIDPEVWKAELMAHQKVVALMGADSAFEIDDVDADIEITAYVYANKTGERYGAREYESLVEMLEGTELVAKSEIQMRFPLMTAEPIPKRSRFVAYDNLVSGETYRLLRDQVPLMYKLTVTKIEDLQHVLLPIGTLIEVSGSTLRAGDLWYWVSFPQYPEEQGGWINSMILISDGVERVPID